ncbi:MAG: ribonuclease HI [archaeon]|nr:ribonuclease HI [archaeon]
MNISIYTDGACQNNQNRQNKGGWAAIILINDAEKPTKILSGKKNNTTNNKMELSACIEGLKYIEKSNLKSENIIIYTDSAYISNCFRDKWYINWEKNGWKNAKKKPVKNKEFWQDLLNLFRSIPKVEFKHVKGHTGNKYNEMADHLAVKAIKN